ncbi:hypothetical protein [Nocardia salmonicida]|uniref:hypothetical protein n=1 Tax=Nocardia salmonicida TaxID=53431 RepID=UPI0034023F48
MNTSQNERSVSLKALIAARIFAGSVHLLTPRWSSNLIEMPATGTPGIVYARMFGVRNLLLAAALTRLDRFDDPRRFLAVNVVIDAVDAVAFLAAGQRRDISPKAAAIGTAIAVSATTLGALATPPRS